MEFFSQGSLVRLNANNKRKYYVYRLIDPRTFKTFYVGKGCDNRVFRHANEVQTLISKNEDAFSLKQQIISEIIAANKEVICVIHRWGLTEREAFEVEAAVIDCYAGLSNKQSGHDYDRGQISVEDFERVNSLTEYNEPTEDYIIIKTSEGAISANGSLYEATRRAWAANINKARKYKYVLSVIHGVVVEVYEVSDWYAIYNRIAFHGTVATGPITTLKGHLIPQKYRKKGMAGPFLYKK